MFYEGGFFFFWGGGGGVVVVFFQFERFSLNYLSFYLLLLACSILNIMPGVGILKI